MRTFLTAVALAVILVTPAAADVIDSGVFTVKITSPREGTMVRSPVACADLIPIRPRKCPPCRVDTLVQLHVDHRANDQVNKVG